MTESLPSTEILPSMGHSPRAGDTREQILLSNAAYRMLEVYKTPGGQLGTRLSNAWLGEHNWVVQITPHFPLKDPEEIKAVASGLVCSGYAHVFATAVDSPDGVPSAVWRVPSNAEMISRFFESHYAIFHMLFTPDRGFAIHASDGDFAVFAGPDRLLRAVLPPMWVGATGTAWAREEAENEHGAGCLDRELDHYAPFMIE